MTFEEFFAKKKIDLPALQAAEPTLFDEFKLHFSLMGEKSFDHSKKFWFNKLRKLYKAAELPAPKKEVSSPQAQEIISKPSAESTAELPAEKQAESPKAKPAGFKPRFKAPITKQTEVVAHDSTATETPRIEEKIATDQVEEKTVESKVETPAAKPAGFKPRFKANITKAVTTEPNSEEAIEAKQPQSIHTEQPNTTESSVTTAPENNEEAAAIPASKPAGFKPRFKANITKTVTTEPKAEEAIEAKQPQSIHTEQPNTTESSVTAAPENNEEATAIPASKPAGFKPRFKASMTKNKNSEE